MTKVKLDLKDKSILEQLQKNARQLISEIAKKTQLPRDVVKYRIKKLEDNGVIKSHHTFLNPSKLGYPLYVYVGFSLHNISLENEEKFISFLKNYKNVIYLAKNSGKWDFSIGICSKNYKEFDNILKEIRRKFSKIIKDYETLPVIEEYKYDYMASLI